MFDVLRLGGASRVLDPDNPQDEHPARLLQALRQHRGNPSQRLTTSCLIPGQDGAASRDRRSMRPRTRAMAAPRLRPPGLHTDTVSPYYDETLQHVAQRARESGDIGKADIGARLMWQRLTPATPLAGPLTALPAGAPSCEAGDQAFLGRGPLLGEEGEVHGVSPGAVRPAAVAAQCAFALRSDALDGRL